MEPGHQPVTCFSCLSAPRQVTAAGQREQVSQLRGEKLWLADIYPLGRRGQEEETREVRRGPGQSGEKLYLSTGAEGLG